MFCDGVWGLCRPVSVPLCAPSCIWVILRPWVFPAGVCFSVWIPSLLLTLPNHFLSLKCHRGTWGIFYLGRWSSSLLESLHGVTLWSKKRHFLPTSGFCSFLLLDLVWLPLEVNEVSYMSVSKRQILWLTIVGEQIWNVCISPMEEIGSLTSVINIVHSFSPRIPDPGIPRGQWAEALFSPP